MNIGIYIENYRAGGLDRVVVNLINQWPALIDRFTLFCNDNHQGLPLLRSTIKREVEFVLYRCPRFMRRWEHHNPKEFRYQAKRIFYNTIGCYLALLWEIPILCRLFRKYGIDSLLIHNGGWPAARSTRFAVFAAKWAGIKKVLLVIHGLARGCPWPFRMQEFLLESVLHRLNLSVVTVSQAAQKALKENTRLPSARVIWNGGRDLSQEAESTSSTKGIRYILGIDEDRFLLGMFGTLEVNRGHSFMIEVMKKLRPSLPMATLLIGGTGTPSEQSRVRDLIQNANLNDQVKLLGFWSDAPQILRSLDLLVNPVQESESFGLAALEAMALKRPVVATRVGGIPEVVEDGVTGFVVDPQDPEAFAKRIIQLARDPELRRRMGDAGYARFRDHFHVRRMAEDYHRLVS